MADEKLAIDEAAGYGQGLPLGHPESAYVDPVKSDNIGNALSDEEKIEIAEAQQVKDDLREAAVAHETAVAERQAAEAAGEEPVAKAKTPAKEPASTKS